MTEEQIQMVLAGKRNVNSHHGVGLQNVKSRLQLIYGERARLEIKKYGQCRNGSDTCFSRVIVPSTLTMRRTRHEDTDRR